MGANAPGRLGAGPAGILGRDTTARYLRTVSPAIDATDLCFSSACDLVGRVRARQISCSEVMAAHLEQIERVNPAVNAIVTLDVERALAGARSADAKVAAGEPLGPLHGLPIAHKDLVSTAGIRTTFGSKLFANHIPDRNDLIVDRLQSAGAISIGKTNTPEFGAGSQTFNEVFGVTRNPYDTSKTCGGSSGGAAVALACGMLPIADGSDMGGSLRNPASFCNVVGMRPSPGRVPGYPSDLARANLAVLGPMARNVADAALLLSAIAGPDARSPIALADPGARFAGSLERDFNGVRISWSRDLGGLPVDSRVTTVLEAHRAVFDALGCELEDAEPDFSDADEIFQVLRAWSFSLRFGGLGPAEIGQLKDTIVWNIEQGNSLTAADVGRAQIKRTRLYHRVRRFMEDHEFMIFPVSQVPPFDVDVDWVREIAGQPMETYIDWMKSSYTITLTGHPAISVPCGFTPEGLPVGIQIVGRHHDDWGVLQLARAFEQANPVGKRRPKMGTPDW